MDISKSGLSSAAIRLEWNTPHLRHRWINAHSPVLRTHTPTGSIMPPQQDARSPGTWSRWTLDRQKDVYKRQDNSSAGAIRNLQQRPHTGGWTAANRIWAFFVCGRSFSQNQNGKTLAWMIHIWIIPVWQIPIGKIPHKEILNKVIIKERNTHGIKYQSINLDGWGRECLSLLWTDGTDLV